MKKVLWISDGVAPTGFSRVAHSIISRINDKFDIYHLAINYHGDPHNYNHKIYPAFIGGDIYGIGRLKVFLEKGDFDSIFILNDIPVIQKYL